MIVNLINEFLSKEGQTLDDALLQDVGKLAQNAFRRQFGVREVRSTLGLSSIGQCLRKQAYKALGYAENGKELDSRAKIVFFMGDLTEMAVLQLARAAGVAITDYGENQASVEIDGIVGHPDALGTIAGTKYLIEVKSMSSYGFKEFEKGQLDEAYRYQCNAYMKATGMEQCVIIALNKDAGVLGEMVIERDPLIITDIEQRIRLLKNATQENLPDRAYKPDEKGWLPWNCLYCGHHGTCWPKAQKILVSNRYKLAIQPEKEATELTTTPKEK